MVLIALRIEVQRQQGAVRRRQLARHAVADQCRAVAARRPPSSSSVKLPPGSIASSNVRVCRWVDSDVIPAVVYRKRSSQIYRCAPIVVVMRKGFRSRHEKMIIIISKERAVKLISLCHLSDTAHSAFGIKSKQADVFR